jgi:hypothetical protein
MGFGKRKDKQNPENHPERTKPNTNLLNIFARKFSLEDDHRFCSIAFGFIPMLVMTRESYLEINI